MPINKYRCWISPMTKGSSNIGSQIIPKPRPLGHLLGDMMIHLSQHLHLLNIHMLDLRSPIFFLSNKIVGLIIVLYLSHCRISCYNVSFMLFNFMCFSLNYYYNWSVNTNYARLVQLCITHLALTDYKIQLKIVKET